MATRHLRSRKSVPLFQLALVGVLSTGLIITVSLAQKKTSSPQAASCTPNSWKCDGPKALRCYQGSWLYQFGCDPASRCTIVTGFPHCTPLN